MRLRQMPIPTTRHGDLHLLWFNDGGVCFETEDNLLIHGDRINVKDYSHHVALELWSGEELVASPTVPEWVARRAVVEDGRGFDPE